MDRPEPHFAELGSSIRQLLVFESAGDDLRHVRQDFLQQFAGRRPRVPRRLPAWLLLVPVAVAAAAVALSTWVHAPLSFKVGEAGAPGRTGDLVHPGDTRAPVRFSDGSSLVLHEQGRMRVLATDRHGARVLVEDGTVDVDVVHPAQTPREWNLEAGPYVVHVTGTRFELSYRASDESLALVMKHGHVAVSGGCLQGSAHAWGGDRLDLSCHEPAFRASIAKLPARPPSVPGGAAVPMRAAERDRPVWRDLLAAGQLHEGLLAAERAGWTDVCQSAGSKDLLALGDAARLFDRPGRAVSALRALRQRFPSSSEKPLAAFTLGRIAFEQQHAYAQAAGWFATYLQEQPHGPLMGDAFGRLIEARIAAGDQSGARLDAEQYLRRFPDGPYASEARGLLAR